MPLEAFVTGPRKTALQAGECIKAVLIPGHRWRYQRFFKVGRRNALAISVINGIVSIDLDKDGAVSGARIALGAVGPTPLRMTAAEQMLLGRRPGDVDPKELDRLVGDAVSPIDDIRASADYRRYMAQVWVRRLVQNGMGGEV